MATTATTKAPKKMGRPLKEYDKKAFVDLIGLGCGMDEICWFFRDESGKPTNKEYRQQNGAMFLKIQLRKNQINLSKTSASMAIFLGKNYLGQSDEPTPRDDENELLASLMELERGSNSD